MNIIELVEKLIAAGVESALTIWPEWQFPIRDLPSHPDPTKGDKGVENRTWPPPAKLHGKLFALHWGAHIGGSKSADDRLIGCRSMLHMVKGAGWAVKQTLGPWSLELERHGVTRIFDADVLLRGAIDCIVRLVGVTKPSPVSADDHYYIGEYGWRFDIVQRLETPIPCKGAQGLWPLRSLLGQDVGRPQAGRAWG